MAKENKRILLIGYNYYPELTGIGKYSGEMMAWLANKGYDCTVITTFPYYPYWRVQEPYQKERHWYKTEEQIFDSGGKIKIYRCPMYVPSLPTGKKRMVLDLTFMITAFFKLIQLLFHKKFDTVVTVAPSFQYGLLGILYKVIRKGRLLYHVQDMQIETAWNLRMIKSRRIINLLFRFEKFILSQADAVSTISEGMVQGIEKKANKPVYLFQNWTDTTKFFPVNDRASLKEKFGFDASDKIILYSGAIGEKQGLDAIIYAAKELQHHTKLKFVICGSGPYKETLEQLSESLNLKNVIFFPLQPYDLFNHFLNAADLHLVIQKANASDLVMPSKLTTILAVGGLALITANEGSGLYALVDKYKIGMLVEAENQKVLTEGIQRAILEDNSSIMENARAYAKNHLSIERIMNLFEEHILDQEKKEKRSKSLKEVEAYI